MSITGNLANSGVYTTDSTSPWLTQINPNYTVPLPEPKYPGYQCKSYDEFRTFLRESPDIPEWVKEAFEKLDNADPWMSEMWGEILSRWTQRRVTEIKSAADRLSAK